LGAARGLTGYPLVGRSGASSGPESSRAASILAEAAVKFPLISPRPLNDANVLWVGSMIGADSTRDQAIGGGCGTGGPDRDDG